jgi:uncharacterized protein YecT (DUF1311 family)
MMLNKSVLVLVSIGTAILGSWIIASAQQPGADTRPCKSNDECDRFTFEQVNDEMAGLMPRILAYIENFAHPTTREEAKTEIVQAQARWLMFRDSACKAEAAMMFLRSARTREGYTSGCLLHMTNQRLKELRDQFRIGDRKKQ